MTPVKSRVVLRTGVGVGEGGREVSVGTGDGVKTAVGGSGWKGVRVAGKVARRAAGGEVAILAAGSEPWQPAATHPRAISRVSRRRNLIDVVSVILLHSRRWAGRILSSILS
jgi:hypothetical protein